MFKTKHPGYNPIDFVSQMVDTKDSKFNGCSLSTFSSSDAHSINLRRVVRFLLWLVFSFYFLVQWSLVVAHVEPCLDPAPPSHLMDWP